MNSPDLPDSMLACQVVEFNKPHKLHHIPLPSQISPHDILVKIAVASLCHTDTLVQAGYFSNTPLPCTASHEASGTVVRVGSSVTDFAPGDRVMLGLSYHCCGTCRQCQGPSDYVHYCPNAVGFVGLHTHGFFAEYGVADSRFCAKLPDGMDFLTAAPLACAGCTVFRATKRTGLNKGEWVAIVGAGGGVGHLGVQFAKALGMKVVAIDVKEEALALCSELGADLVIDGNKGKEELLKEVQAVTAGLGVDAAINVTEHEDAPALACAITKMHGLMVQVALTENVTIPYHEFVFRDIRVQGTLVASAEQAKEMLDVATAHKVRVKMSVFHGLEEIPKLLEFAQSGNMCGKAVVIVDQEQLNKEKAG